MQAITYDNGNSGYSNHVLNIGHAYGSVPMQRNYKNREQKKLSKYVHRRNTIIYIVSQKECARILEGVPYVKYANIIQNTYAQI
jgi:hypothetical protein